MALRIFCPMANKVGNMLKIHNVLLIFWASMGIFALFSSVGGICLLAIFLLSLLFGKSLGLFILAGMVSIALLLALIALIIALIKRHYLAWAFAIMGQSLLFFLLGLVLIVQFFNSPFSVAGFVALALVALFFYITAVIREAWLSEPVKQAYSIDSSSS